tara:strand:- start:26978 stop:27097 length:120 start_codon:yes stop_codon:yes gene_type:complete
MRQYILYNRERIVLRESRDLSTPQFAASGISVSMAAARA